MHSTLFANRGGGACTHAGVHGELMRAAMRRNERTAWLAMIGLSGISPVVFAWPYERGGRDLGGCSNARDLFAGDQSGRGLSEIG